eukprot:1211555-Amphidinium_carterae.1
MQIKSETTQTESKSDQCEINLKGKSVQTEFDMVAKQSHLHGQRCHLGVTRVKQETQSQTTKKWANKKSTTTSQASDKPSVNNIWEASCTCAITFSWRGITSTFSNSEGLRHVSMSHSRQSSLPTGVIRTCQLVKTLNSAPTGFSSSKSLTEFMYDCGAAISVAPPSFAPHVNLQPISGDQKLQTITDDEIKLHGIKQCTIIIGGTGLKVNFILSDKSRPIIGNSTMEENSCFAIATAQRWITSRLCSKPQGSRGLWDLGLSYGSATGRNEVAIATASNQCAKAAPHSGLLREVPSGACPGCFGLTTEV